MPHFVNTAPLIRRLSYGNSVIISLQRGLHCTASVSSVTCPLGRSPPFLQGGCRYLGNQVRGPSSFKDVLVHKQYAFDLLKAPGVTYDTFKQQCESLRLFLFVGVCGILSLDLFFRPPKSSYWKSWSCFQYLTQLRYQLFSGGAQSVFFNNHYRGSSEGWQTYQSMVLKRPDFPSDSTDAPPATASSGKPGVSAPIPTEVSSVTASQQSTSAQALPAPSTPTEQPASSTVPTNVPVALSDPAQPCSTTTLVVPVSAPSVITPSENTGNGSYNNAPQVAESHNGSLGVAVDAKQPVSVAHAVAIANDPTPIVMPPSTTLIQSAAQC